MQKYKSTFFVLLFFTSFGYSATDTLKMKVSDSVVLTKKQLEPKENVHIYFRDNVKNNYFKDVLPIITLILGIFLNRGWDKLEKRRQYKKYGQRWKDELELLTAPLKGQIEACNKFLVELEQSNFKVPNITMHWTLQCTAFDALDKSELIRYLEISKGDHKTAVRIASGINVLIGALKLNRQIFDERLLSFISGVSSRTLELRNALHDFAQNLESYQTDRERAKDDKNNPHVIALWLLFEEYIQQYQQHSIYDIDKLEKEFIPKYFLVGRNLRLDSRIESMTASVQKIFTATQNLRNERIYIQTNIEGVIERYSEYTITLENILKEM